MRGKANMAEWSGGREDTRRPSTGMLPQNPPVMPDRWPGAGDLGKRSQRVTTNHPHPEFIDPNAPVAPPRASMADIELMSVTCPLRIFAMRSIHPLLAELPGRLALV